MRLFGSVIGTSQLTFTVSKKMTNICALVAHLINVIWCGKDLDRHELM